VPYLKPSIQLLLKAKNPRPKDIADFNAVLAVLPSTATAVMGVGGRGGGSGRFGLGAGVGVASVTRR
jgi:hypothetical protein